MEISSMTATPRVVDITGDWCIEIKRISRTQEFQKEIGDIIRSSKYTKERFPVTIPLSMVHNNDLLFSAIESPDRHEAFLREALEIHEPRLKDLHHIYVVRFTQHPRPVSVKEIHATDIGRLIAVTGIIKQCTEISAKTVQEAYRCRLCGDVQLINQNGRIRFKPARCTGDECRSKDFIPVVEQSVYCDNQKIRMQDFFDGLKAGAQPESLDIEADDDLTRKITGGDHVVLTGILRLDMNIDSKSTQTKRWLDLKGIEMMSEDASQIQITEEDEQMILAMSKSPTLITDMVKSIAPKIFGCEMIKLAMLLQQFGGVFKEATETEPATRGDFHILIAGDPGVAKSQLLKFILLLSPRSIFISGKSSSSAGLTASVTKDAFGDGRWSLEAGAAVLADGGVYVFL
jgi:replicative DNA helicase Mcm